MNLRSNHVQIYAHAMCEFTRGAPNLSIYALAGTLVGTHWRLLSISNQSIADTRLFKPRSEFPSAPTHPLKKLKVNESLGTNCF